MVLATFSGSTDTTRSDVARISAADKNGARIAGLEAAWIFRDRPQQNRVQIEQTRFPAGAELPASPSKIPVLSLPGDPCGARRRIDLAATACGKIALPG